MYTFTIRKIRSEIFPYTKFIPKEEILIGRSEDNDIVIRHEKAVSRIHTRIKKVDESWRVESLSINGFYLNGQFTAVSKKLTFGDHINILGFHMVFLGEYIAVDEKSQDITVRLNKALRLDHESPGPDSIEEVHSGNQKEKVVKKYQQMPDGKKVVHRAPRVVEEINTKPIDIDPPPEIQQNQEEAAGMMVLSHILMAVPMISGSLFMIYVSGREGEKQQLYMYGSLIMAVMSVLTAFIWTLVQNHSNRKKAKEDEKLCEESYHRYLREKEGEISGRYQEIKRILLQRYIHVKHLTDVLAHTDMLWTRTICHTDFLSCRLGVGDMLMPAPIRIAEKHFQMRENILFHNMEELQSKYKVLTEVPVLISLDKEYQIGLVALKEKARLQLARNIIVQLAFYNCYTEVRIGLIYDSEASCCKNEWDYMRWMPHVWSESGDFRWMASNQEEARSLFYRLFQIIRKRRASEASKDQCKPYYILFIAAMHFLEGEPVERFLTGRDNPYGIIVIWLSPEREKLPNSCTCIVENNQKFHGIYRLNTGKRKTVDFDLISGKEADHFTRKLSTLTVIERFENKDIPVSVTFFELFGIKSIEELETEINWKKNRIIDSLRVPVGLKAGGKKNYLDIHEKYHGPHGLVAGTTGSGKSELLQTYILALSVLYGPESVNFFLIDYKGGGMSGLFDGLPHLCGQISNLSGSQVYRAMTALRSENQRRQRLFQKYRVNNISAYMSLYYKENGMEPMPHLLIIVDEFAELKKEEPDFMQELISIAQVGRSLGLHLILATQKPGGTIDEKIWSNSRFRLCLKVQEKQDSIDMLHKPDAADIQHTGQCCFQVGNDEIYEVFQTGWSGAVYRPQSTGCRSTELIRLSGEADYEYVHEELSEDMEQTQFEAVKEHIIHTAKRMGVLEGQKLWVEPLPKRLYLSDLKAAIDKENQETAAQRVYVGLADDPANQSQFSVYLDLAHHSVVCGLPMSGKSTLLQTILWGIVSRYSPEEMQVYVIDYSNAALKAFMDMPQVGGIILEGEEQKNSSLFHLLLSMLEERRQLFQGGNYYEYLRAKDTVLPRIVVMIDNFAAFNAKTGQLYEENFLKLCKEGENAGIVFLVSCGGFSMNEFPIRFANYFKTVFCLELKDYFAYSEVFGTLTIPVIPEKGIKGRGVTAVEGRILEFQTALAFCAEDDYERMQEIKENGNQQKAGWKGIIPAPIRVIPQNPTAGGFYEQEEVRKMLDQPGQLPVAFWEKTAEIVSLDTERIYCFLITGRKKSGKHNMMRFLMDILKEKSRRGQRIKVFLIDPERAFEAFADLAALTGYLDSVEKTFSFFESMTELFQRRKKRKKAKEEDPRYYIFIENLRELVMSSEESEYDMTGFLSNVWAKGAGLGITFIGILNEEDYLVVSESDAWNQFQRYKTGIHFGGNLMEDCIFDHSFLPYEVQVSSLPPGQGYLFLSEDTVQKVIVPQIL